MRVTNEELFVWYERLCDKTMNSVCENFRSHFLQDEVVNIKSLFNKIKRVCDKIRDLKRHHKSKMKLDRCLAEDFHPAVLENNHDRALASTSTEKERCNSKGSRKRQTSTVSRQLLPCEEFCLGLS